MDDIFASSKYMFRQAERHVRTLETMISRFVLERPWFYTVEDNDDASAKVHKIQFTERLSEDIPGTLFDASNNLRATLDQIAFAIGSKNSNNPKAKSAKFPFGPTEFDMLNNAKGGCKDLPAEIVSLFKSFKPFKDGNKTLWALNELANAPKHQTIVPVSIGANQFSYKLSGELFHNTTIPMPKWDASKNEFIVMTVANGSVFKADMDMSFTLAINHSDAVLNGANPVAILHAALGQVQQVLSLSITTCKCIGLTK